MYFVTICTKNKEKIFWKNEEYDNSVGADSIRPQDKVPLNWCGRIAQTAINNISQHYSNVTVENYIIMPNHIHLIVFIDRFNNGRIISAPTLSVIIGQMKRWISKQLGKPVFQRSFHYHIIRNKQDYKTIYTYIENTPSNWTEDCFYIE